MQRGQSLAMPPFVSCSNVATVFDRSLGSPSTAARRSNAGRAERRMPFHSSPSACSRSCRCAVTKASKARAAELESTGTAASSVALQPAVASKLAHAALRAFSQQKPSNALSLALGTVRTISAATGAATSEALPGAPAEMQKRGTTVTSKRLIVVAGSTCQSTWQARWRRQPSKLSKHSCKADAIGFEKISANRARACNASGSHPLPSASSSSSLMLPVRVSRVLRRASQEAWLISLLECRTPLARQCQAVEQSLWQSTASTFESKRWRRPRSKGTNRSTRQTSTSSLPPCMINVLLRARNFLKACPLSPLQKSAWSAPLRYRACSRRSISRATTAG
mmetsp:Transcript_73574/g.215845  ORF Transcript_73574/g.215845 Transcript_73574/m.215845 type:complete len:337 (-) Transcript_73574:1751-2761(-)